jgi:wobble nucleotide-excising tRNase
MIAKITKLKKFGIFRNFSWLSEVPEFKKFNLIYGWNRSGKTIFSRVFAACEKRSISFKEYPENGEFELRLKNNSNISNTNLETCNLPIKVFNQDFIEENISFDPSNPCNPIVYVSEEDIDSRQKLENLTKDNKVLIANLERAQGGKITSETTEERFRKATALNIKTTVGNLKVRDKYYDYDKSNLNALLESVGIENFTKLSDEDFDNYKTFINSETRQKQSIYSKYDLNFSFEDQNVTSFDDLYSVLGQLLSKKIVSETLRRLEDDQDLNSWVKQGFDLHKKKNETERCLFCQKPLDDDLLASLSKHFNKDYEDLQNNINNFISELENLKKHTFDEKSSDLYSDLQNGYQRQLKNINALIGELNKWIDGAIKKLHEKSKNLLSIINVPEKPKDFKITYDEIIEELNRIIQKHNATVDNHDKEIQDKKEKLEHHLIAVAIEKQDYRTIKQELKNSIEAERTAKEKLSTNHEEIKTLERKTSNIGKAVQKINKHLEDFFGRKEVQLELDEGKKGYIIKRDGQPAKNLSEGEKTAIAFSYFIVKAQERDFKIKEGIVIIDDPLSSFDSNFIYHCFSVIRNHFKDTGQLFILTHNFQLFNLVKEWFLRKNREKKKGEEICEFYMIENIITDDKRHAVIKQLEETLRKFKSEYHFLFARLNQFVKADSPEYADFYIVGNIARRFLEIFTNFKIPTTGDLASKISQLPTETINNIEKDKVYRLIQEFSHGSDPTSTIEHKDKRESQEAIKILLNIVKESDPKHFELLEKNL